MDDAAAHRGSKERRYAQLARIRKAMAGPARLELRDLLAESERRTADSLATELGISMANASQHLKALREAALVETRNVEALCDVPGKPVDMERVMRLNQGGGGASAR